VVSYKKPAAILKVEKELKTARLNAPDDPVSMGGPPGGDAPDCKQQ